jgi:glycosyltransferase involved in cell wall biosynthesis
MNANASQEDQIPIDAEYLRSTAWDISERRPAEAFTPPQNHVALAMVNPTRGFAHWRISHEWIEATRLSRADMWHNSRMTLRLYDVSYINFTGLNANSIQDQPLPCICGQMFFNLHHAGTWQLGEVGFLLTNGEFIPAARSNTVSFPRASTSSHGSGESLLVDDNLHAEPIGNIWDQGRIMYERRNPQPTVQEMKSEEIQTADLAGANSSAGNIETNIQTRTEAKESGESADCGQIKREINFGPTDRMIVFIGPLEHAAGPDLLLEAMPVALQRVPNLRVAFAGAGEMQHVLQHRAHQLGVDYAVRFLGHVDRGHVTRLLQASEAVALPSRGRVPFDDAVVDLARQAGRAVVTTHGGPAHRVRHEETGIVTYDNPGSMVWALDRILGDPANTQRMGRTAGG